MTRAPSSKAAPAYKYKPIDADDELIPPSEVYKPESDTAFTRGAKTGYTGMGESLLTSAQMATASKMGSDELRQWMLDRAKAKADPRNAALQEPSFTDVGSFGEGLTFAGKSLGQMAGSVLGGLVYGGGPGAVVGAGIGGAAGATAGGVGALPGAAAGAITGGTIGLGAAFLGSGPGATLESLLQDEGVQKALVDKTLDPHALLGITTGSGLLVGALDAFAPTKFVMKVAGKQVTKEGVKVLVSQAIKKGLVKGTAAEGGTEAVQQAIDETTAALAGGDIKAAERAVNVLNSFVVGTIGGAPGGAIAEVTENARIPTAEEEAATADEASPVTLEGIPETPEAAVSSTPGATGATQPAAPVGTEPTPPADTTTAPVTTPDDIDPDVKVATGGGQQGAGPRVVTEEEVEGAIPEEEAAAARHRGAGIRARACHPRAVGAAGGGRYGARAGEGRRYAGRIDISRGHRRRGRRPAAETKTQTARRRTGGAGGTSGGSRTGSRTSNSSCGYRGEPGRWCSSTGDTGTHGAYRRGAGRPWRRPRRRASSSASRKARACCLGDAGPSSHRDFGRPGRSADGCRAGCSCAGCYCAAGCR